MALPVQILTANGASVPLEPSPGRDDPIAALRSQVALALGKHHKQIQLLCSEEVLTDGPLLNEVLPSPDMGDGPVTITAVVQLLSIEEMKTHIQMPGPWDERPLAFATMDWIDPDNYGRSYRKERFLWRGNGGTDVIFPEPQDINVNMLPFVMGQMTSVTEEYQHYWPMIEACNMPKEEHGKVGYLTVHESLVPKGQSQRRPGLHIETPGLVMTEDGKYHNHPFMWGCGLLRTSAEHDQHPELPKVEGGIYMASNVANSCEVWQALITDPGLVVGHHGDLEHIREVLGKGHLMEPNTIYWLTDKTPHESLPLKEEAYRQFFRVVTSALSAWFPEHSTENRLGTTPDPTITKIIEGSKFDM